MERTIFNNRTFYGLLIVILAVLLSWNSYNFWLYKSGRMIIPIFVQAVVLVLVLVGNKHAKMGIKILAILLLVGSSLSIIGKTIQVLLGDDIIPEIGPLIVQLVIFSVGLAIYHYNNTTVEVKIIDRKGAE